MQPERAAARLRVAFEALEVWPSQPSAQRALTDSILRYVGLLAKWNRTYNLTAVRDADQMLPQHVFDSAAVALPLRRLIARRSPDRPDDDDGRPRILDVGSGAGLPGIVLAMLWPDADFVLVEPVAKKAAFLQHVKTELALANVEVARCRVEELPEPEPPAAIVCRAFASLADYAAAVESLVGPRTVVVAMKARPEEREKRALTNGWTIAEEIPLQVPELDARRNLVVLERLSPDSSGAGTT